MLTRSLPSRIPWRTDSSSYTFAQPTAVEYALTYQTAHIRAFNAAPELERQIVASGAAVNGVLTINVRFLVRL